MTTAQIITLVIAISGLLGHIPAAVKALQGVTSRRSAPAATTTASNAPPAPPAQP